MASKNDVTGDVIKSKVGVPDKYADGWERIFGNKIQTKHDEEQQNVDSNDSERDLDTD